MALSSQFSAELPGIETDALPGNLASNLQVRHVSLQFSTSHYLRIRFRVLTASRALPNCPAYGSKGSADCRDLLKLKNSSGTLALLVDGPMARPSPPLRDSPPPAYVYWSPTSRCRSTDSETN
jgi:hypothetical protein